MQKAFRSKKVNNKKQRIAIFASGAGSNAKKIIEYFAGSNIVEVAVIVCNKEGAGVLNIATAFSIPFIIIERERFFRGDHYIHELKREKINFIILAGFLWKIPSELIRAYPHKIINIHPALLPKYGGKGMYGQFVHEAVIRGEETESGITIHFVDELYDHGKHILQVKCPVLPGDTPEILAQRIHQLEYEFFPKVIEEVIKDEIHLQINK